VITRRKNLVLPPARPPPLLQSSSEVCHEDQS
jgi:hypothetical protein